MSRSPENTFVNGASNKRIFSSKLLNNEANNCSAVSFINHSRENSIESTASAASATAAIDGRSMGATQVEECPCRANGSSNDNSKQLTHSPTNTETIDVDILREKQFQHQELNGQLDLSMGLFSRVPSQQYKVGKYLIAVHRKITRHDSYFLSHHKSRPSLFGVPLLIPNMEGGTHKDLYCAVWQQVSRLLSPLPASTDQANHAADW